MSHFVDFSFVFQVRDESLLSGEGGGGGGGGTFSGSDFFLLSTVGVEINNPWSSGGGGGVGRRGSYIFRHMKVRIQFS